MDNDDKEKNRNEEKKGFWKRFREALQSPPGRFLCALLGTAAIGGMAYAAGRNKGRTDRNRDSYRYDGKANSGGVIAEQALWDSLGKHLNRAVELADKGRGGKEA